MRERRKEGRKFANWTFEDAKVSRETIRIEVRAVVPRDVTDHDDVTYVALVESPELEVRDKNLQALRDKVSKRLRELLAVEWKPMLAVLVDFEGDRTYYRPVESGHVDVVASRVQVGVVNGKPAWRDGDGGYIREGAPTGFLVEDNPANRQVLHEAIAHVERAAREALRLWIVPKSRA